MSQLYSSPAAGDNAVNLPSTSSVPRQLLGFLADNLSGANRWIMVFDSAATPSNGTAPVLSIRLPAAVQESMDLGGQLTTQISFVNGISIVSSTTSKTLTIGSAGECCFAVFYV